MAPPKTDQELLNQAISVNIDPFGKVDLGGLQRTALELNVSPSVVTDYVIKQQSIQEAMAPEMTSGVSRVVQEHGTFAPPNVIDAMTPGDAQAYLELSLIHISEPTRPY